MIVRTSSAEGQWTRFKALTQDEYSEFCEKLPRTELYRCRGCPFVHRFPSKVRRHYHYRHSVIPPYRCGHCSYRAVERGKVVKHCRSAHPSKRLAVLDREDDDPSIDTASDLIGDRSGTYDLSTLRNINAPTVDNRSRKPNANLKRAINSSQETVRTVGNRSVDRQSLSGRSTENLSSTEMADEDSVAESEDYESSDEYVPASCKKKSNASHRSLSRSDRVAGGPAVAAVRLDSEFASGVDNEEHGSQLADAGDDPACNHIPCETIFAINRTTYRPRWQSAAPAEREEASSRQATRIRIKTEPVDDYECQSATSGASVQTSSVSAASEQRQLPVRAPAGSSMAQRQFYCVYCGLSSRWNRRDVRLHVMHVHVGVRAFSCGHCGFGNSKNRAIVRSHCAKSHPGRKMLLIDNEPVFDAIDSVQDKDNVVAIAFTTSEGTPLLTLEELDQYLSAKGIKFRTPTSNRKKSEPMTLLSGPETVRETMHINETQPQKRPNNNQLQEMLLDSVNFSELSVNKEQMKELNCQWKCRQCDFTHLGFAEVEIHIVKEHLRLEPYSCPYCHKYYSQSQAVLGHIEKHHADCERRTVSTVDAKSGYIRRHIKCVSVDVQSTEISPQRMSNIMDCASSTHSRPANTHRNISSGKSSEPEKDTTGVPHKPTDEERDNDVHRSAQSELVQTDDFEVSSAVNSCGEKEQSSFSSNALSHGDEECRVTEGVPSTASRSPAAHEEGQLRAEVRGSDDVSILADSVPDSQLQTGENFAGKQTDIRNEPTTSNVQRSHADVTISNDLPTAAEERGLPEDSSHVSEHKEPLDDFPLPPDTSDVAASEGNVDDWETTCMERVRADSEEQQLEGDLSVRSTYTQQGGDATVATVSDASTVQINNEAGKNSCLEEKTAEAEPVSAEQESVEVPPEENAKDPNSFLSTPVEMDMETVDEGTNNSYVENPVPSSIEVRGTDSSPADVQQSLPSVDTIRPPCDGLADNHLTESPEKCVVKNLEPLCDSVSPPSNGLSKEDQSNGSSGDVVGAGATAQQLNSEDHEVNRSLTNDDGPGLTRGEPRLSAGLREDDDGLSSDSSSLSDSTSTSTWRCEDCSFVASSETQLVAHRRSRQQYRCVYCPDFLHSSVVHLRHHCLTRHPGKPISYKHTVLPCTQTKSTTTTSSADVSRIPASVSHHSSNAQGAAPPNIAEAQPDAVTATNAELDEKFDEAYDPYSAEESSNNAESDNSEDSDWDEYEPVAKKRSKMAKKNVPKTANNAEPPAAAVQGGSVMQYCDICGSYSTPNSTVMRHHVMTHLQYYPYSCPHCTTFRAVRSFPIIKHIRVKHCGKAERFDCNPDPEMEKKVRKSCHRVKSRQPDQKSSAEAIPDPLPQQPVETATTNVSRPEEREQPVVVGNRNKKVLYKCKIYGLKTHLRGDFRHHVMREMQYKPYK